MVEKTTPIYRHHLLVICRSFLQMGNISGVHKLSAIVTAFLGVGRSGEWSLCSYKGSRWDYALDAFTMDWNQKKTAKQSPMNFFTDKNNYEMDFYTALGYLALVSNGNASPTENGNSSMFPFIAQKDLEHFGAARVMTNYLRSSLVHDNKKELWNDICGTGLRSGATTTMFVNGLSIAEVSLRGGWYFTDITKAYEYLIAEEYTVSLGGKVLAGWDKQQQKCAVPKCKFMSMMTEKKRKDFESFMTHFRYACNMPTKLVEVMCASVLKNLELFIKDYGSHHIIIRSLYNKAERCGISVNELLDYGKIVQDDYNDDNISNIICGKSNDINEVLAVSLQRTTALTNQEMKNIAGEIKLLRAESKAAQHAFHNFTTTAQNIIEELKELKSRQRSSPLKEKRQLQSPVSQNTSIEICAEKNPVTIANEETTATPTTTLATSSLRAALFELHDIATPISIVFYNWYYYKCHLNEKNFVYKGLQKDPKREARRTKAVINFCYSQSSMDDRNTIDYPPSDTSTTLFDSWAVKLHNISTTLENTIMNRLLQMEGEKKGEDSAVSKKPRTAFSTNVSAVYQRLEMLGMIKKYSEEPKLATKTLMDMWHK